MGLIAAWLAFGKRGFIHLYHMEKERQAYLLKIRELEEANEELMEEIRKLKNDSDYIEATARRELGLVRDNEMIFRFSEESRSKVGASSNEKPR